MSGSKIGLALRFGDSHQSPSRSLETHIPASPNSFIDVTVITALYDYFTADLYNLNLGMPIQFSNGHGAQYIHGFVAESIRKRHDPRHPTVTVLEKSLRVSGSERR